MFPEVALVIKSGRNGYLCRRQTAGQQGFSARDPHLGLVGMRGQPNFLGEDAGQMKGAQVSQTCQFRKRDVLGVVLLNVLPNTPDGSTLHFEIR